MAARTKQDKPSAPSTTEESNAAPADTPIEAQPDRDAEITREVVAEAIDGPAPPKPQPEQIRTFDPSRYLTKVGAADYLEVKWRLVWLRDMYPDAQIETEMLDTPDPQEAVFRAKVTIPLTGATSQAHGSETYNDFRDFREKAETKAIGRALAGLGFGTQFSAYELDTRIADTPVALTPLRGGQRGSSAQPASNGRAPANTATRTDGAAAHTPEEKFRAHFTPDLLENVSLPIEDQYRHWNAALDAAVVAIDPKQGAVDNDLTRWAWGVLMRAATQSCGKGGVDADQVPLQRWKFYRIVEHAPTPKYMQAIAIAIETTGSWDSRLAETAKHRQRFLDDGGDPLKPTLWVDEAGEPPASQASSLAEEPPDIPF